MKNRFWPLQLPIIAICTLAFQVAELGSRGDLFNRFLFNHFHPLVSLLNGLNTKLKFELRGHVPPRNKVVIIDIDNDSLARLGRWPWRRDLTAALIQRTFDSGAKVVGLDMVFSEEDRQISDELRDFINSRGITESTEQFETDLVLQRAILANQERLVTGWVPDNSCQPAFNAAESCPVAAPETLALYPPEFARFAIPRHESAGGSFDLTKTPLFSVINPIVNLPIYNEASLHSGSFGVEPDRDGVIRRAQLVVMGGGKPYPALALEMARIGLGEELRVVTDASHRIQSLSFAKQGREIPVSKLGLMDINFRGPSFSFPYVSALEVLGDAEEVTYLQNGRFQKAPRSEVLDGAYALLGLSAIGVHDMRAFPYDPNTPGVEGHATILDNLLADDMLRRGPTWASYALGATIFLGGLALAHALAVLEALPGLLTVLAALLGLGYADVRLLFANDINLTTSPLLIEILLLFIVTVAAKYVLEEKNKKFIRGAFSKYVAPAIVDSILKDPAKLTVGGDRKELTILFSDIRSFTSFSEKMDAKALAQFLNDYLGTMTDIVFECEGTLDKYIGDAVMAFWGAPLDQPVHARNACLAAIRMQQVLAEHRPRFQERYGIDVAIGIGINTGIVNVGNMGSERIFEYTVIGDHVNLASRLEGLTKYYGVGIVTTRFTLDAIAASGQPAPAHRVLDSVKVKGKKTAVELIELPSRELPSEGIELFNQARLLYRERRWDEAVAAFRQAEAALEGSAGSGDGPCQVFIERCQELKQNPPNADWDGSWEMHSK
jgi:adenylate cyclase